MGDDLKIWLISHPLGSSGVSAGCPPETSDAGGDPQNRRMRVPATHVLRHRIAELTTHEGAVSSGQTCACFSSSTTVFGTQRGECGPAPKRNANSNRNRSESQGLLQSVARDGAFAETVAATCGRTCAVAGSQSCRTNGSLEGRGLVAVAPRRACVSNDRSGSRN